MIQKWTKVSDYAVSELENYISQNPSQVQDFLNDMNPESWADESFALVRTDVYKWQESRLKAAAEPHLQEAYLNHNLPIIKLRLIAAGVRLAALLNQILA